MSTVTPQTPHKPCGSCQGQGVIYQDVGQSGSIEHRCSECEGNGWVPGFAPPAPKPLIPPPDTGRSCVVCQEAATHADLQRDGRTVHQAQACALFTPDTPVSAVAEGDVVASYRLMNYYAPMLVAMATAVGPDKMRTIQLRHCRFITHDGHALRLRADGPTITREFAADDLMIKADPRIWGVFVAEQVPPEWRLAEKRWPF